MHRLRASLQTTKPGVEGFKPRVGAQRRGEKREIKDRFRNEQCQLLLTQEPLVLASCW